MSKEFTEIDTDTPKGRLLAFCRMTGLSSNREIEKTLDLGNGYFRTADKGMNTGTICKVARRYPTLNLNWLICGCGDIYSHDNIRPDGESSGTVAESRPMYNAPAADPGQPGHLAIRMFENAAALLSATDSGLPPRWFMIEAKLLRHRNDVLVRIGDDSLAPVYPAGEYLQISPSRTDRLRENEKRLSLIVLKDADPLVRLFGCYPGHPGMCSLSALNPDRASYPDLICTREQIVALWEVVNVLRI